jgi:hypothetical protein
LRQTITVSKYASFHNVAAVGVSVGFTVQPLTDPALSIALL